MSMVTLRDVVFVYLTGFALYCLWVGWRRDSWSWNWIAAVMLAFQWSVQRFG